LPRQRIERAVGPKGLESPLLHGRHFTCALWHNAAWQEAMIATTGKDTL
jgi:hypothetical protein